jgi:hypothetical protein
MTGINVVFRFFSSLPLAALGTQLEYQLVPSANSGCPSARFGRRNPAPEPGVNERAQQRLARAWEQRGNSCSVRGKCARREIRVLSRKDARALE